MISAKVMQSFVSSKRISCFRTYILIKLRFDSKINTRGKMIASIAQLLGTSKDNIRKHISQLHKAGLLEKGGNDWFHIVGNIRYSEKFGEDLSIRGYNFTLEQIKDIKQFRTLLYTIEYEIAATFYKNQTCVNLNEITAQKSKKKYSNKEYRTLKAKQLKDSEENTEQVTIPRPILKMRVRIPVSRYTVSTSFASLTTNRKQSTISKHRVRAKQNGFVSYKRTFEVHHCTEDFLEKTNYCKSVKMPLFKFHNTEINSVGELYNILSYSEDATRYRNTFPLKDNKGQITAIVSELTPEMIFNIKSNKIRNYVSKEDKMKIKESIMKVNSMKN